MPRDHSFDLPKKVRKLGLRTALSSKMADGRLLVVDSLEIKSSRTAELKKHFDKLGLTSALIIDGEQVNDTLRRAVSNLAGVDVLPVRGANVYDILRHEALVLTRQAVAGLEARLK